MDDTFDKVYYINYREMKNDKKRRYYLCNKKLITCECGRTYYAFDTYKKQRHEKSLKHQRYVSKMKGIK